MPQYVVEIFFALLSANLIARVMLPLNASKPYY
jgi:hypothetical protein